MTNKIDNLLTDIIYDAQSAIDSFPDVYLDTLESIQTKVQQLKTILSNE